MSFIPDGWFFLVPLSCALLDGAVVLGVLFSGRRPRAGEVRPAEITSGRALRAAVAGAVSFAVKLPPLLWLGVNLFGLIHVVYLALVVTLPLAGVVTLASGVLRLRRVSAAVYVLAVASCVPAPVGVYASFVEPFRLKVEHVSVSAASEREGREPLRVGVLADLQTAHVTDYEREAVQRLMAARPDVILLPGDIFQGDEAAFAREEAALRDLLRQLTAPGGVYLALGNVDPRRRIERLIQGTQVELLVNRVVRAAVGDRRLSIGGVELRCASEAARRTVDQLETAPGGEDIRILVAHYPDVVLGLPSPSRIDLVVAGHTHGGQVQVPFLGPPLTLSHVPRQVAAGGYHDLAGRRIYVSRGVGCERGQAPRIRFLAPPEVSLLVLGAKKGGLNP